MPPQMLHLVPVVPAIPRRDRGARGRSRDGRPALVGEARSRRLRLVDASDFELTDPFHTFHGDFAGLRAYFERLLAHLSQTQFVTEDDSIADGKHRVRDPLRTLPGVTSSASAPTAASRTTATTSTPPLSARPCPVSARSSASSQGASNRHHACVRARRRETRAPSRTSEYERARHGGSGSGYRAIDPPA